MPSEDAHYFVVKGRRWRKTAPKYSGEAAHGVGEGVNGRASSAQPTQRARCEGRAGRTRAKSYPSRGCPERLLAAIRALLRARPSSSSICPSDAARVADGKNWRTLSSHAREVARDAGCAGNNIFTQRSKKLSSRPPGATRSASRGRCHASKRRPWQFLVWNFSFCVTGKKTRRMIYVSHV